MALSKTELRSISVKTRAACGLPPHLTPSEIEVLKDLMSLTNPHWGK